MLTKATPLWPEGQRPKGHTTSSNIIYVTNRGWNQETFAVLTKATPPRPEGLYRVAICNQTNNQVREDLVQVGK